MVVTVGNENGDPTGYCPDGQPFTTLLDPTTSVTEGMQVSMGMNLASVTSDIPSNSIFRWSYATFESPSGGKMDFASNGKLTSDLYVINGKTNDIFEAGNYAWGYAMNKLGFGYPSTWVGSNAFGSVRANFGAWGLSLGDNPYDQKAINAGYHFKQ